MNPGLLMHRLHLVFMLLAAGCLIGANVCSANDHFDLPDTTATPVQSDTPFPDYAIDPAFGSFVHGFIRDTTAFLSPADSTVLRSLGDNTPAHEIETNRLVNLNDTRRDEFIAATPALTPGLFAELNDAYRTGAEDHVVSVLLALSHSTNLTDDQLQAIRTQVIRLLDAAASSSFTQKTPVQFGDDGVLRGGLILLARQSASDSEDISLRALDRPNDLAVNRSAAEALTILASERGLHRVREIWKNEPEKSSLKPIWKDHLDRITAAVAAKMGANSSSSTPSAIASNPNSETGKEPVQKPAPPPLAEVRGTALAWVGGVVAFAVIAMAWLWMRLRRK